MRSQRLSFPDGTTSFTVVDETGMPFGPAEDYLRYLRVTASPNTVNAYARALARWLTHLERSSVSWDDIRTADFGEYLTWLRTGVPDGTPTIGKAPGWLAPSSVSQHAAAVVAFYGYMADAHGLTEPFDRLHSRRLPGRSGRSRYVPFLAGIADHGSGQQPRRLAYRVRARPHERPPVLTPEQVSTILAVCTKASRQQATATRDQLMIAMLWETGMRLGELLTLQHRDLNVGRGDAPWIDVVPRQDHPHGARVKGTKHRRIYISDRLEADYSSYLWSLIDAGIDLEIPNLAEHHVFVNVTMAPLWSPMRPEVVYQKVRAIRRQHPSLPAFTPHWFRHTHATALLLAGIPPHVVMRRLGHADIQTTLSQYGWVTEDAQMRNIAAWTQLTSVWRGLT